MKLSQTQILFIGLLAVILVVLIGVGLWVFSDLLEQPGLASEPVATTVNPSPSFTENADQIITSTPVPTLTSSPTSVKTLAPTFTSEVVPSLTPIVKLPVEQTKANSTPDSTQENSECTAQLEYILSIHQDNLQEIDEVYLQQIANVQGLLEQAIADDDVLAIRRLTREKERLLEEYDAAIKAEIERYQEEKRKTEFVYCN